MKNVKFVLLTMYQGDSRILFYIAFAAMRQGKIRFNRRHRLRCKVIIIESNGSCLTQILIDLIITLHLFPVSFGLSCLLHHGLPWIRGGCQRRKIIIIRNQGLTRITIPHSCIVARSTSKCIIAKLRPNCEHVAIVSGNSQYLLIATSRIL